MDRSLASSVLRRLLVVAGFAVADAVSMAPSQAQEMCGGVAYPFPYTDVSGVGAPFCPGIMEAYVTGVTKGTTPTTFSPNANVTRLQMTTFLQRSLDQGLARTNRRAALNQWWTQQNTNLTQTINVGGFAQTCAGDGENIWMSNRGSVVKVQASTGNVLGTWTGAGNSEGVVVVDGKVYVAGDSSPGSVYMIDPTQPPGPVTTVVPYLGDYPYGIAYDGTHVWTANLSGTVTIIAPGVSSLTVPGFQLLVGILYDGAHIWVTDAMAGTLLKLDSFGSILQTVTVGANPEIPVFDGANIWVPNFGANSITVVQASTGNVVATINADANNLLNGPMGASFDGERILVTNNSGSSVTVFKAADLSFIANVTTGTSTFPLGACSDGISFWVPLQNTGNLVRF
jgi:hypothetical protein